MAALASLPSWVSTPHRRVDELVGVLQASLAVRVAVEVGWFLLSWGLERALASLHMARIHCFRFLPWDGGEALGVRAMGGAEQAVEVEAP